MPVCACSFYVGHVYVYSSLEGCRLALIRDYGNNWSFLYASFFLQNNPSLSLYISICLLLDTIA